MHIADVMLFVAIGPKSTGREQLKFRYLNNDDSDSFNADEGKLKRAIKVLWIGIGRYKNAVAIA